ncbi:hypothetical protein [Streptomyces clavuligerus]|uniref:Secreted protein n=1 Tax=Streptomyces clavuligerus TaxID=1901 RepID=B5GMK9_STRCL|nr:hypothetical protein [Streptomyces clavuligerus]ANW22408.1 hypothetical protein BB341_29240 [Streptomyces clavuligerus]AXU17313.1 hypothetical protein D1794_32365 [Streptomyces clavuligerus]EDY47555.1 hypothetical protein SSCG_00583 [Streptomyces clavuligerus]EFG04513.1 Hypothetical protein SCLAV_p1027 [Streptomyces clavuligerus]MBY6307037.1 hypothetical protein [Streptomyces clavuligerus]
MRKMKKGAAALATGLLALSGGMALLSPATASAAPATPTATPAAAPAAAKGRCTTKGWEWVHGNRVYATCLDTMVNVRVFCSNGGNYQSNPAWKRENNEVSCPSGTNVLSYTTAYRS